MLYLWIWETTGQVTENDSRATALHLSFIWIDEVLGQVGQADVARRVWDAQKPREA